MVRCFFILPHDAIAVHIWIGVAIGVVGFPYGQRDRLSPQRLL